MREINPLIIIPLFLLCITLGLCLIATEPKDKIYIDYIEMCISDIEESETNRQACVSLLNYIANIPEEVNTPELVKAKGKAFTVCIDNLTK